MSDQMTGRTRGGTEKLAILAMLLASAAVATSTDARAQQNGAVRRPVPAPVVAPPFFQRALERGWRSADGSPGHAYWQQWTSYDIEAELDPATGDLSGSLRIRYVNNAPVRLGNLVVHLHQNLHAEGVARNEAQEVTGGVRLQRVAVDGNELTEGGSGGGPGYRVNGTIMQLQHPNNVEPGDTVEIVIDWEETLPQSGAGRMGHSDREMYFVAYWFPKMAVFDDLRGWDAEPYLSGAEFYDGFGDYRVSLTVPAGWTVMGTGTLENAEEVYTSTTRERLAAAATADTLVVVATREDRDAGTVTTAGTDGKLTYRFATDSVRDFAWTTSNLQRWDATSALVPDRDEDGQEERVLIHSFWREDRAPLWEDQWLYGKQSIEHHSRYTGFVYPWPHMTSVEGDEIIGGGMEFPMLTLIGPYEDGEAQALFNVTSHELAHMWIPMIVGTNEKRHAWMDEGSTTFLENMSRMEYWPGVDHHRVEARGYLQVASAGLEQSMMRHGDWYEPGPGYGIASYAKPATLMVALRSLLGRETWEEAYRAFIDEWAYKHPTPWDFFNTFERFAGRDLDWFWTSFYFETWTLDHAVSQVDRRADGTTVVRVEDRGFAPYPATVRITTATGETIEREVPVEHWLDGNRSFGIELPASAGRVTRVELDPGGHAPDVDRSNNFWPRG